MQKVYTGKYWSLYILTSCKTARSMQKWNLVHTYMLWKNPYIYRHTYSMYIKELNPRDLLSLHMFYFLFSARGFFKLLPIVSATVSASVLLLMVSDTAWYLPVVSSSWFYWLFLSVVWGFCKFSDSGFCDMFLPLVAVHGFCQWLLPTISARLQFLPVVSACGF